MTAPTLPPPIEPQHPAPWWCPTCGQLEAAGCNHPRWGQSGPPPIPPGRAWATARRRALGVLGRLEVPGDGTQLLDTIGGAR